jgi:hypothetical protein
MGAWVSEAGGLLEGTHFAIGGNDEDLVKASLDFVQMIAAVGAMELAHA